MRMLPCPAGLRVPGCPQCEGTGYIRTTETPGDLPDTCPEFEWAEQAKADVALIEASA
jgi:hypothetical protein